MSEESGSPPAERRALFHVVRGAPSGAEVAALTMVLAATAAGGAPTRTSAAHDRWSDPAARLREPLHPGQNAWRTSTWPR